MLNSYLDALALIRDYENGRGLTKAEYIAASLVVKYNKPMFKTFTNESQPRPPRE